MSEYKPQDLSSIQQSLRLLPQVEKVLRLPGVAAAHKQAARANVVAAARAVVDDLRQEILSQHIDASQLNGCLSETELERRFQAALRRRQESAYGRVINGTGVVLHTGLGRAVLPSVAVDAFESTLRGCSIVEIDRASGERNEREAAVVNMLTELTGAEDGTVVNNNAAATLLILSALARNREVIVSRGELVEIGGSFRIPDIMGESGARLVEVGTTNRTYQRDYERAITPETGLLLQVHTSNFKIQGFTHQTTLEELAHLGEEHGIPVVSDLGSGCFIDLSWSGFRPEPLVTEKLRAGADLVCFSGDKLLGGPQAGIVIGKREFVRQVRRHSLFRALRVDKVTLVLLEATLRCYRDPDTLHQTIPVLRALTEPAEQVQIRASRCLAELKKLQPDMDAVVVASEAQAGSGALPAQSIPSWALALKPSGESADELAARLRSCAPPVFSRVQNNRIHLDFRTIAADDEADLVSALMDVAG